MKLIFTFILFFAFLFVPNDTAENKTFNRVRTFDVQNYTIRLNFDRAKKTVFADTTIDLQPLSDSFDKLELDAEINKFDSIRLSDSEKDLEYIQKDGKLIISLDKAYSAKDLISVNFKYSIKKPKKGIYFVNAKKSKGKVVQHSQIWTQGEAEETRHWLPSFDFPDDKATTEQFITVNNSETVIANGELKEKVENSNGTATYHYKMSVPYSLYLMSFVVGTYDRVTDKYKDIPLSYYVYKGQKSIVPLAFGKTKDMFRIFEDLTKVDYPYNKYDQTMVANFNFGGMENITATTLADSELEFAKYKLTRGLVEDLVSHELAHSWFGNLVTCRNWAELWLNESFATFMEAAYKEKMYSREIYDYKIQSDADEYFAYASLYKNKEHSLFNRSADTKDDNTMFTPITYQKGSAVIHTLREEIGDEAFWKAINIYLQRNKFANVETKDLQMVMEETSGKNLQWFFDQWIYGSAYPVLKVNQTYNKTSRQLILSIKQTQTGNQYTPKAFTLPLEIEISMSKLKKTEKILLNQSEQVFYISVDEKPFNLKFDKKNKIPLKDVSLSKLIMTE